MTADSSLTAQLNNSNYQRRFLSFLLIFRWITLTPALWLFLSSVEPATLNPASIVLLAITIGFTLLITLLHTFKWSIFENPIFIGADLLFIAIMLTLSGAGYSPYTFYALSPLLFSALFFEQRGLLLAATVFSSFYLIALLFTGYTDASLLDLGVIFTQLAGLWLIPLLFAYPLSLLKELSQNHQALILTHDTVRTHNSDLTAIHQQLEVIHELTLSLQGATDKASVLQRLSKAVVEELDFTRAVAGVVNSSLQRIENWQIFPTKQQPSNVTISLMIEQGLIIKALLDKQVRWCSKEETPVDNEEFITWLGQENWAILPMVWQEQTVGVLLVAVQSIGPVDMLDDRWAILTSLVSQTAATLGTIDHTRRLGAERERNRIARDIHDTVAQSLFGIAFTLDACVKLLPAQAELVRQELAELQHVADKVRRDVRQSILDIWPSALTQDKFKADLDKYVTHASLDHAFEIDFTIEGDFDGLPPVIRRTLYRVSQEALANTVKHANIDTARIYLYVEPDETCLSIRDKGQGFDPQVALAREQNREHFGLRGMQERIQHLNGTCDILSQIGHGTQILIRIPIHQNQQRNGRG